MKNKKVSILCSGLFAIGITALHAQQGAAATGGQSTGTGGVASYTIGLIDYTTATGVGGKASQGLQQVYEIETTSGFEETGISLSAFVYPNPLAEFVKLRIDDNRWPSLTYQLHDALGKILINKKVEGIETSISMLEFANAVYFIKVMDKNRVLKTFKIIKAE